MRVSIIIKALNEEQHIADALRSALAAVAPFDGEVILADSVSSDDTVRIAREFPVAIVQLANPEERRCGVGPQLGFQFAQGDYVYILDGDMELDSGFLRAALEFMAREPEMGGVAGLVEQQSSASYQFRGLKRRRAEASPGEVQWLDMGGLYRRSAVDESGYFSNRNLHAFEEMELGLRLSSLGWKLRRLPVASVRHRGYELGSLALLRRRWKTGYLRGAGEVLRASLGRPYFKQALLTQKYLLLALGVWAGLAGGLLVLPFSRWPLVAVLLALTALVAARAVRIRSLKDALIGQLVWQVHSLALVRGFFSRTVDPHTPIAARMLQRLEDWKQREEWKGHDESEGRKESKER